MTSVLSTDWVRSDKYWKIHATQMGNTLYEYVWTADKPWLNVLICYSQIWFHLEYVWETINIYSHNMEILEVIFKNLNALWVCVGIFKVYSQNICLWFQIWTHVEYTWVIFQIYWQDMHVLFTHVEYALVLFRSI